MSTLTNQEKLAQFDEFFSISHKFNVNLTVLDDNNLPDYDTFLKNIPLPFKMASDMVSLDQSALRPIQGLSGVAGQLVEYLNHQSHKIELLIGYILSQQDNEKQRYTGKKFGGGGIIFESKKAFEVNQILEMKIFFLDENCAIYCLGEIVDITNDDEERFQHKVVFHFLREEDREVLVRTSLHLQSKQLQQLANKRQQESSKK